MFRIARDVLPVWGPCSWLARDPHDLFWLSARTSIPKSLANASSKRTLTEQVNSYLTPCLEQLTAFLGVRNQAQCRFLVPSQFRHDSTHFFVCRARTKILRNSPVTHPKPHRTPTAVVLPHRVCAGRYWACASNRCRVRMEKMTQLLANALLRTRSSLNFLGIGGDQTPRFCAAVCLYFSAT